MTEPTPEFDARILLPDGSEATSLIPADVTPPWVWLLIAFLLLVIAALLWFFLRKPKVTPIDPRGETLQKLRLLQQRVERESPYVFSIEVCDILKTYCEHRFQLQATRQTSPEFLESIQTHSAFTRKEREALAKFLERCDAIKFARSRADSEDNVFLLELAKSFVDGGAV